MELVVYPMAVEDLEEVLEIENSSFPIPWSRNSFLYELLENQRALYLAAKNSCNKTVGYIGMWIVFDEGHITNLAVHPAARRQGVAKFLLKSLIKIAQEKGIKHLTLEVRRSNVPAQQLYQKFGFVHMGVRRRYYLDNNEDALIMWKGPI
ncbi:MAG: ribosomal protein S18-alanine N-acetyltransferase [Firmicutes bacterium]|nr:ribosomal protein S18-alanine N-acetyltransferase [Bacillota bacterium]